MVELVNSDFWEAPLDCKKARILCKRSPRKRSNKIPGAKVKTKCENREIQVTLTKIPETWSHPWELNSGPHAQKARTKACFKRRATAVLSWLDCSTTLARLGLRRRI